MTELLVLGMVAYAIMVVIVMRFLHRDHKEEGRLPGCERILKQR